MKTNLALWLTIKSEMQDAKMAVLKSHGKNWNTWKELDSACTELVPPEGIKTNRYHITVVSENMYRHKGTPEVFGTKKRIVIHSIK